MFDYSNLSPGRFLSLFVVLLCAIFLSVASVKFFGYGSSKSTAKDHQIFVLSTGSKGGNYYPAGKLVQDAIHFSLGSSQESETGGVIRVIESSGTLQNLDHLRDEYADLAIVQRNVLLNSQFDNESKIKNVSVVAPLFQEGLVIYSRLFKGKFDLHKLTNAISSWPKEKGRIRIAVDVPGSESFEALIKVLQLFNVDIAQISFINEGLNYSQMIDNYNDGLYDCLAIFSRPLGGVDMSNSGVATIDSSSMRLLNGHLGTLIVELEISPGVNTPKDGSLKISTVGTWALLVGRDDKLELLDQKISDSKNSSHSVTSALEALQAFSDGSGLNAYKSLGHDISKQLTLLKNTKNPSNYDNVQQILKGLRPHGTVLPSSLSLIRPLRAMVFGSILLVFIWLAYRYRRIIFVSVIRKNYPVIFAGFFVVILLVASAPAVHFFENQIYENLGLRSEILDFRFRDLIIWIVVSSFTGEYNGVFPKSTGAKLVLALVTFVSIIGTITALALNILAKTMETKRREGKQALNFTGHVVLCGWSPSAPSLIREYIEAIDTYHNTPRELIVIVPDSIEILEGSPQLDELHRKQLVHFVSGQIKSTEVLKRACIERANTVVLLAESKDEQADERTILRALAISRYCRNLQEGKARLRDSIYMIAEINNATYESELREWDINEVVNNAQIGRHVLLQSMMHHDVSNVLNEVLDYNNHNEFYKLYLNDPVYHKLRGYTYDELLGPLRLQGILLLGIKRTVLRSDGSEEFDNTALENNILETGLRQIMINPIFGSAEAQYRTGFNDQLVVFASDGDALLSAAKNIAM